MDRCGQWIQLGSPSRSNLTTGELVQRLAITVDNNAHTNAVYSDGPCGSPVTRRPCRNWTSSRARSKSSTSEAACRSWRATDFVGCIGDQVWAVDDSGAIVEHIDLTNSIEVISLELSGPDIWVGIRKPGRVGTVQQIERSTGTVREEFEVDIPARMVVGFGSLWVTDSGSNELYRIGPID